MKNERGLDRLFLREKPVHALMAIAELDPAYAALVAKRIDSTFPHTTTILSQLERAGLIKARPEGRVRLLELTARGKKVASALKGLSDLLMQPVEEQAKVERLKELISAAGTGPQAHLKLGPLRRDIFKLKEKAEGELRRTLEEMDGQIVAILGCQKI